MHCACIHLLFAQRFAVCSHAQAKRLWVRKMKGHFMRRLLGQVARAAGAGVIAAGLAAWGLGGCSKRWSVTIENQTSVAIAAMYVGPPPGGFYFKYAPRPKTSTAFVAPGERVTITHDATARIAGEAHVSERANVLSLVTCEDPRVMYRIQPTRKVLITGNGVDLVVASGSMDSPRRAEIVSRGYGQGTQHEADDWMRVELAYVCSTPSAADVRSRPVAP